MEEDRRVEDFSAGDVILGRMDGIPALEFDKMDTTVDGDLSESGGAALPVIHYHVYNISQVENVQIGTNNVIDKTGYDDRDFVDDLSKTDSGTTAPSVIHNHYYIISQVENVQIGHDNVMNTSACEDEDFVDEHFDFRRESEYSPSMLFSPVICMDTQVTRFSKEVRNMWMRNSFVSNISRNVTVP
uniref:Uncharacterized protein n=1 Tax=Branchiostoma floridae TaxID=7739 RepID=C3ZC16_BRAFL|eukprot:XP_002593946.1 hypothetical protein BRAFLDRAFT_128537 [Branchiostoma floridae]